MKAYAEKNILIDIVFLPMGRIISNLQLTIYRYPIYLKNTLTFVSSVEEGIPIKHSENIPKSEIVSCCHPKLTVVLHTYIILWSVRDVKERSIANLI